MFRPRSFLSRSIQRALPESLSSQSQGVFPMLHNDPFYWQHHSRPNEACLLLHGLGGGVYEMQWLAHQLHREGFTVQGINYPGHTDKAFRMPVSGWEQWYQHISDTYESLIANYDRVSIVAFSTGCPLALKLAKEHHNRHQVDKLVLLSPFFKIKRGWYSHLVDPERVIPHIHRLLPDVPRGRAPIMDPEMLHLAKQASSYRTFNLSAVNSALQLIASVKPHLCEIENPSLIVMSKRDRIVDPSSAEYLMSHLGSEYKELLWLNRSNHVVMLDAERQMVFERVHQFLLSESPSATPIGIQPSL